MSRPVAQTALSDGFGAALHDFADVVDIASLAWARRRHMRRQAMDAVDHLIALLDALDAATEDCEPDDDADPLEVFGVGDPLEDAEDDGTAEPSLGAPEHHPDLPPPGYAASWGPYVDRSIDARQIRWAAGSTSDREVEDENDEDGHDREDGDDREPDVDDEPSLGASNPTFGYLGASVSQVAWALGSDDHDREHDPSDAEPYLGVVEWDGYGNNWSRSGNATCPLGTDVEAVDYGGSDDGRERPGWLHRELDVPLILRGMREDASRGRLH